MVLGVLVHIVLVRMVCPVYGIDLPLGFHPGVYVASVTVSPWIYALVVMMTSSMISIVFPLIRMGKMTPIALMDQRYSVKKRKRNKEGSTFPDIAGADWWEQGFPFMILQFLLFSVSLWGPVSLDTTIFTHWQIKIMWKKKRLWKKPDLMNGIIRRKKQSRHPCMICSGKSS